MIIIRTRTGDSIEITEDALWPDAENTDACFCGFVTNIRLSGFLLLPHVYIPAESIAMITRDARKGPEKTGQATFN